MKAKTNDQLKRMWNLGMYFGYVPAPWFAELCKELSERKVAPWK